jgi:hypothetical protein
MRVSAGFSVDGLAQRQITWSDDKLGWPCQQSDHSHTVTAARCILHKRTQVTQRPNKTCCTLWQNGCWGALDSKQDVSILVCKEANVEHNKATAAESQAAAVPVASQHMVGRGRCRSTNHCGQGNHRL